MTTGPCTSSQLFITAHMSLLPPTVSYELKPKLSLIPRTKFCERKAGLLKTSHTSKLCYGKDDRAIRPILS